MKDKNDSNAHYMPLVSLNWELQKETLQSIDEVGHREFSQQVISIIP